MTRPLTETELAGLEAAAKAARGGWWPLHQLRKQLGCAEDAAFVALAKPATVLRLLAELAAVKRERDELREQLRMARTDFNNECSAHQATCLLLKDARDG